jgi:hypothetical protein
MAVQTPLPTMATALRAIGLRILPKPLLMLLPGHDCWQHTIHRLVSSVVAISVALTTITKDNRPIFLLLRLGIYWGKFRMESWRTVKYFNQLNLYEGMT